MITKDVYRRNESYSDLLLDGISDFARGEQIILSKSVSGADEFPLIKVEIDKNRRAILSDTAGRNGKGKLKYETWLNRYTKDSMGLSPTEPKYDANGDLPKGARFFQYALGERYLFSHIDIEPDCSALEKQCEKDIESECRAIDNKWAGIINNELSKFMEEWNKLEYDYNGIRRENKNKIPTYRAICKYLEQSDILEEDRLSYTRELFNNVNVFGITCTSRDRFTASQLKELANYGIESVDIRSQGIDVVIIDEVSKSSFLDLLIPILYGKTVILVGDHRQLPPMYDLRHLRENDFEGLDESIISKQINDRYGQLLQRARKKRIA